MYVRDKDGKLVPVPVINGGYYVPKMDGNGDLQFVPSIENMPAVPKFTAFRESIEASNQSKESALAADKSAESAQKYAEEAEEAADRSVKGGAYISFTVDEFGYLQMEKTENADDITFSLDENGNLIMEV
jgi:hypothetical protein